LTKKGFAERTDVVVALLLRACGAVSAAPRNDHE
jgi:hypothetical protein